MKITDSRRIDRIFNDLGKSVTTDIAPIIQPGNPEGGYYGVPRAVLCYVDVLGLLFSGWAGERKENGDKKDFATSPKAKLFIKNVLSQIDYLYELNGDLMYDMYRHGTVHLYAPKKLISRKYPKMSIEWLIYKGERECWDYYENRAIKLRHLQVIKWGKDRYVLPVSISVLYSDLIVSIGLYRSMIYNDKSGDLLRKFLSVVDALDTVFDGTSVEFWK